MNIWNRKWQYDARKSDEQFVFIHIPKTAGTTFRIILYNHFVSNDIYPNRADLKKNGGLYLSQNDFITQEKFLNKSMVVGHYHVSVVKQVGSPVKTLAFFRNPIDRLVSTIKHIKKYDKEFMHADVAEIVKKNWRRIVWAQCGTMGYNFKTLDFKAVRQNMLKLDFIGITEYFDESIQLCNATFDWQLENIEPKNAINEELFSQISGKTMAKISRALLPEIRTYNLALTEFQKRCKVHKIDLVL